MAIQKGDKAPNFTLINSDKKEVSLSDYKGKNLVVLFFPLAFTGVCTKELCSVSGGLDFYNDANAEVVGISVDSVFTLEKFKAENDISFPLLSDFNKDASTAYDSIYEVFPFGGMKGVSKRSAFVVDGEGVVQYAEVLASAGDLPNFEAIQETLKGLK
ncbi:MAG: redoxin domain-containing protein [Chitinophagales bacterium]